MSGILTDVVGTTGGGTPQCADVVFTPSSGTTPLTVALSTTTINAHIFYRKHQTTGLDPVHLGDSAVSPTIRIGSNSGSVSTGAGNVVIRAVAYEPTHLDSNITEGSYEPGS